MVETPLLFITTGKYHSQNYKKKSTLNVTIKGELETNYSKYELLEHQDYMLAEKLTISIIYCV